MSSSQALAFNLFFPFVGLPWSESEVLLRALDLPDRQIASFEFESVPDKDEATNFDFCAAFTDGTRLLVEVKLTESSFGKCKNDEKHQTKRATVYRARLEGKVLPGALDSEGFFGQYQLFRSVSHLRGGDTLVLLLPRANRRTFDHAERFVKEVLGDKIRPAVRVVALEDLLNALTGIQSNLHTAAVIRLLREKYLLSRTV